MYNQEEILKFLFQKLLPQALSNFFTNVTQNQAPIYYIAQSHGLLAQMIRLCLVFTYIWQEDIAKILKVPRSCAM